MDHTGHRSVAMARLYTRRADAFADHDGEGLLHLGGSAQGHDSQESDQHEEAYTGLRNEPEL